MRRPSAHLTQQTVTLFTPGDPTGVPTQGGYKPTWTKAEYTNVKFTEATGAALSSAGKSTSDRILVVFYDVVPTVKEGETLIVTGTYNGSVPPDTGFYRVTHVDKNCHPDGTVHNVAVSGA